MMLGYQPYEVDDELIETNFPSIDAKVLTMHSTEPKPFPRYNEGDQVWIGGRTATVSREDTFDGVRGYWIQTSFSAEQFFACNDKAIQR